jgi:hypothetical protein
MAKQTRPAATSSDAGYQQSYTYEANEKCLKQEDILVRS